MFVIFQVTGNALRIELVLLIERTLLRHMAGIALDLTMFIFQLVLCIAVMIESGSLPVHLRVARIALGAVAPLVTFLLIVLLMAGETSCFQFDVEIGFRA